MSEQQFDKQQIKIPQSEVKTFDVAKHITSLHDGWQGYLFSQSEDDMAKELITVNFYYGPRAAIIVTEKTKVMLEAAINHFIALNKHADSLRTELGYNGDDVVHNRISARIFFSFK
jgi:hypothetical protein